MARRRSRCQRGSHSRNEIRLPSVRNRVPLVSIFPAIYSSRNPLSSTSTKEENALASFLPTETRSTKLKKILLIVERETKSRSLDDDLTSLPSPSLRRYLYLYQLRRSSIVPPNPAVQFSDLRFFSRSPLDGAQHGSLGESGHFHAADSISPIAPTSGQQMKVETRN